MTSRWWWISGHLGSAQSIEERNFSEATAQSIDTEVKALVEEGRERASVILTQRRTVLDSLTEALEEKETLDREDVCRIVQNCSKENT